jgi:type IV pilus assembly protein PilM
MPARSAVGLDIGTSCVRAAELSFGRSPTLTKFGQVALPAGAVRDGEVADPASVAPAIKELWRSVKFSSRKVVLGVSNQRVVVRQVDLPWMPVEELRKSLAFQVQDFLPMPVEQAILDFHPVEEVVAEDGTRMLRLLLVAAARSMVDSAMQAVKLAGLGVTQIDLTPFAILRSVGRIDHLGVAGTDAEALVDVGASVTNIVVHQNGVPKFVRILLMGGDDITDAVAERMGVPVEQAESVKQEFGLARYAGEHASDHPAVPVLENSAGTLLEEVRGSLDYYLAQPEAVPIRGLLVSGGGARLKNFAERLGDAVRLPVEAGSPIGSLSIGRTGLTDEQLRYVDPVSVVPVGLAMGAAA